MILPPHRARGEGHLDRHVRPGQPARGVARADAAPGAAAVPRRRVLGRPGRAAARPAARAPATSRSPRRSCIPSAEILVVTTPQLAAAEVAERAGVDRPADPAAIAGVIENMSWLELPDGRVWTCSAAAAVRRSPTRSPRSVGAPVPLLGQVPLDVGLREGGDTGVPVVLSHPESPAAVALRGVARGRWRRAAAAWPAVRSASRRSVADRRRLSWSPVASARGGPGQVASGSTAVGAGEVAASDRRGGRLGQGHTRVLVRRRPAWLVKDRLVLVVQQSLAHDAPRVVLARVQRLPVDVVEVLAELVADLRARCAGEASACRTNRPSWAAY